MALADLAAKLATEPLPWRTCQVCHALATIPKGEADALRDLLRSKRRYSEIVRDIADDPDTPLDLTADALSRHARGHCEAKERLR